MSIIGSIGEAFGFLPWQAEDFVSSAGNAISAGGKIAGLFGASDEDLRNAATPQFAYRPMEDALTDTEKLRAYLEQRTQPIVAPTRQLTSQERGDDVFSPKAVMALEDYVNARRQEQPAAQQTAPVESANPFPQSNTDVVALRRLLATDPNDMSPAAKMKRLQLNKMNSAIERFQDGQVNPYTGEKFDRKRFLDFYTNQADYETANPRSALGFQTSLNPEQAAQIRDEQDALYRQTYIPSKSKQSFLGKYGAPLALGAMTLGAGMVPGLTSSALNTIKGVTSLARGATGR